MAPLKTSVRIAAIFLFVLCAEGAKEKAEEVIEKIEPVTDFRSPKKNFHSVNEGAAYLFADELKQTLERYLFGICPQNFKVQFGRSKNATTPVCDLDTEQADLPGRLATLALRAHSAARADCARFGAALANTLGELARTAASNRAANNAANEANKKRKLSKSQKAKIQAKQRTALAVKKKAAALAAAAAAKVSTA